MVVRRKHLGMALTSALALLVAALMLPLPGPSPPATAATVELPAYSGDGPGQVTCSLSFYASFSPPLTRTGGGTGPSAVSGGTLSGCTATTNSVTVTDARFTGSYATSPLTCQDTFTDAADTLHLTWYGTVNGPVATYPDAIDYAGNARFATSTVTGGMATGSFAGPVVEQLQPPAAGTVAADCALRSGLRKILISGTITLGSPTPATVLPTSWWVPPLGVVPWQWELDHTLDLSNTTDMGTNDTLPNGQPAPDPVVYDIDAIDTPASTVAALHAMGDHAICYTEVGSAGNYYAASEEGLATSYFQQFKDAGVLGRKLSDYPEYFLNINSQATLNIVEDMIAQQCYAKGFDAVETDLDETNNENEGNTGFTITESDEQNYLTALAGFMHSLGLGWIAKNLDDTGDNFATIMEPLADGMITEQCNQYDTCGALSAYVGTKAVFNAEYPPETTSEFCVSDNALGFNGALFPVALNGPRHPCQ